MTENLFRVGTKYNEEMMTIIKLNKDDLTEELERNFVAMLDNYYAKPETWNRKLDDQLRKWYLEAPKVFPKRPYFSPSSTDSCPLELYVKGKGAKRDISLRQPHQARWQRIGTAIGDMLQRDILDINEQERKNGNEARFRFLSTNKGEPAFEEFAATNKHVRIPDENGEIIEYYLYGMPDGIMQYTTESGEVIRVGLEIKSKQTTAARTSTYSMRDAEQSHIKQVVAYSHMYDVDYYMIVYVNASKQSWFMDEEQYAKTPDLRVFAYNITDEDRYLLLSDLANVQARIKNNDKPPLDVEKWTFNNYKAACVAELTDDEISELEAYVKRVEGSNIPDFKKRNVREALEDILRLKRELDDNKRRRSN